MDDANGATPARRERAPLWTDLLTRLGGLSPGSAVHGDLAEGFAGEGDVDLFTPAAEWQTLEGGFERWASDHGLGPVITCRHRRGVLVLVALTARDEPFFELEARAERHFRGGTLFRAEDLAALVVDEARGFRRVRPGAAGVLKLVPNGIRPGGRPAWSGRKLERVGGLLRADPEGMRAAAELFGGARRWVLSGAGSVAEGGWDRRAMALLEAWAAARALRELPTLARRVRVRLANEGSCAVLTAVRAGRRVPPPRERWLAEVAAGHRLVSP